MAKPFPIVIDVEEMAVGSVLRQLNTMSGIIRLHLDLKAEKVRQIEAKNEEVDPNTPALPASKLRSDGRQNSRGLPPYKNFAYRIIADILIKTPAHLKILSAALERNGITTRSAVNGYIHRLSAMGLIKRTAPGTYRLSEKGVKLFSGEQKPKRKLPAGMLRIADNSTGCRKLILDALKNKLDNDPDGAGLVSSAEMKQIVIKGGYSDKNLSTTGMKMRNAGLMSFVDGDYYITEEGLKTVSTPMVTSLPVIQQTPTIEEGLSDNG